MPNHDDDAPGVFSGLSVLDLTHGFAGAVATMVMADFGAETTRVEPPPGVGYRGDPAAASAGRRQWHRGKHIVTANLRDAADRARVHDLIARTDIVVESFRPGAMARLGLDADDLCAQRQELIWCSITGFGTAVPWSDVPGYEHIVMAASGWLREFGYLFGDGTRPVFSAVPMASFAASQAAVQGICAALIVRGRTGAGQRVDTSLLAAASIHDLGDWLSVQVAETAPHMVRFPHRPARDVPTMGYIPVRTSDGRWIQFANFAPHLFWAQAEFLGLGHLRDDPQYAPLPLGGTEEACRSFWMQALKAAGRQTHDELMRAVLADGRLGADVFRTTDEGMDHPQARFNGDVMRVDDPVVGPTEQIGPLARMSLTPGGPHRRSPETSQIEGNEAVRTGPTESSVTSPAPESSAPLDGVVVVECAAMYAAPFGPALLADLGARVIKVEPLDGDLMRVNQALGVKALQGKESIALDLKDPRAQQILHRIIERADLFMHNYRPGVPARLGIDYETLKGVNPALVYLYAGAYGDAGPYSGLPAYHPIAGAICGNAIAQAGAGHPAPPDVEMSEEELRATSLRLIRANEGNPDNNAATVVATALLLGLVARERFGIGQEILTTMQRSNAYAMSDDWIRYPGKHDRPEVDADLNGPGPLYRLYACDDGTWVFLAVTNQAEWSRFAPLVDLHDDERFADEASRSAHSSAMRATLEERFLQRDADSWEKLGLGAGVACVRADRHGGYADFLVREGRVRDERLVVDVEHPVLGRHWRHGATVHLASSPPVLGPGTTVGQHTRAVLVELGYDDATIDQLAEDGVIALENRGRS